MAYSNNISVGFDTFNRDSDVCCYSTNDVASTLTATNSWTTQADTLYSTTDHLQDQIDMLKLQLNKLGHSSEKTGSAMKKFMDKLAKKPSLRSELSTLTAWQTIQWKEGFEKLNLKIQSEGIKGKVNGEILYNTAEEKVYIWWDDKWLPLETKDSYMVRVYHTDIEFDSEEKREKFLEEFRDDEVEKKWMRRVFWYDY